MAIAHHALADVVCMPYQHHLHAVCYAARRSPLRGKACLASRGTNLNGPDREGYNSLRWTDRRGRGSSWTGRLGPLHLARTRMGRGV